MTGRTPLYQLPYLVGSDPAKQIAPVSQQQAEGVEALLRNAGTIPLDADYAAIVERLNALEANALKPGTGLAALNGYTVDPGTRFYTLGDVVILIATLRKSSGVDAVNCLQLPAALAPPASLTFQGVASVGGAATATTMVLATNGTLRNWTTSSANTVLSLNVIWKVGA